MIQMSWIAREMLQDVVHSHVLRLGDREDWRPDHLPEAENYDEARTELARIEKGLIKEMRRLYVALNLTAPVDDPGY